jgi:hypothetical protein
LQNHEKPAIAGRKEKLNMKQRKKGDFFSDLVALILFLMVILLILLLTIGMIEKNLGLKSLFWLLLNFVLLHMYILKIKDNAMRKSISINILRVIIFLGMIINMCRLIYIVILCNMNIVLSNLFIILLLA